MTIIMPLSPLALHRHAAHCTRSLAGLPTSLVDVDSSRLALGFYCIGSLDILGLLSTVPSHDHESWHAWVWEQYAGGGFKPSSYMSSQASDTSPDNTPNIIMTYTALLTLAIFRDDFKRLDRPALLRFIQSCQLDDGSFSTTPGSTDADLRAIYCAFAISSMLNDWSGINLSRAIHYIRQCRTFQGGYGQTPFNEAQGGSTYCAIASLYLAPTETKSRLNPIEQQQTVRWLMENQLDDGGFCGRTGKESDACYCFWSTASLTIMGVGHVVDSSRLRTFMDQCQFKFGGIAKSPGSYPDPYHTYLSLAALALCPTLESNPDDPSWCFKPGFDPLWNATEETADWIRKHVCEKNQEKKVM